MAMQRFLFIMRHAPYHGVLLQERLDMLLITAAFDQPVSVLFLDEGVFQLLHGQQPPAGIKETLAIFDALALYGVEDLYVELESLRGCGLQVADLAYPVKVVQRHAVPQLLQQFTRLC